MPAPTSPALASPASKPLAATADCNIWWNEIRHDTFNSTYRSIVGPAPPGGQIRLRLRVAQGDLTWARVRVWNDRTNYDTAVYLTIDPDFGTLADFQGLVADASDHGTRILLDGVFNHTTSDSRYFDRYERYDSDGNLTSPPGSDSDNDSGACESPASLYRNWYFIPDSGSPANGLIDRCDDGSGAWTLTYSA